MALITAGASAAGTHFIRIFKSESLLANRSSLVNARCKSGRTRSRWYAEGVAGGQRANSYRGRAARNGRNRRDCRSSTTDVKRPSASTYAPRRAGDTRYITDRGCKFHLTYHGISATRDRPVRADCPYNRGGLRRRSAHQPSRCPSVIVSPQEVAFAIAILVHRDGHNIPVRAHRRDHRSGLR